MTPDDMCEIIRAKERGEMVLRRLSCRPLDVWVDDLPDHLCDFHTWSYKLKPPAPKPVEGWVPVGLVCSTPDTAQRIGACGDRVVYVRECEPPKEES